MPLKNKPITNVLGDLASLGGLNLLVSVGIPGIALIKLVQKTLKDDRVTDKEAIAVFGAVVEILRASDVDLPGEVDDLILNNDTNALLDMAANYLQSLKTEVVVDGEA